MIQIYCRLHSHLPAATGGLVLSNAPIATLNPAPSPISTFSFGTTTSSNVIPEYKI